MERPEVSIVIPVYNEAEGLAASIEVLVQQVDASLPGLSYELILCENGSTDNSAAIAARLAAVFPQIRLEQTPEANYGQALRHGIEASTGDVIVIFNADFWDVHFLAQSLPLLPNFEMVIGSKNLAGSLDDRPIHRRLITIVFNWCLRALFGFRGTDTHGLKAMQSEAAKQLTAQCKTNAEIFDTELVLRGQMNRMRIAEIPISVKEQRPSRYGLLKRAPKTFMDLVTLIKIFGIRKG
jgi:glycosyltransferase involved in cell wall biosynthesis